MIAYVPFNRSMANSSNSSKVMLSVGGILYICKPYVLVQAFCELSRGLIRLLLFFRLPGKYIFLARCMDVALWKIFLIALFPPNEAIRETSAQSLCNFPTSRELHCCSFMNWRPFWSSLHKSCCCYFSLYRAPLAFPTVKFIIQREKPTAFVMN